MNAKLSIAGLLSVFLVTGGMAAVAQEDLSDGDRLGRLGSIDWWGFSKAELTRIKRGARIAPVPLDLKGKDPARVYLGCE